MGLNFDRPNLGKLKVSHDSSLILFQLYGSVKDLCLL